MTTNPPNLEALRKSNAERSAKLALDGVAVRELHDLPWAIKFRVDVLTDYLFSAAEDGRRLDSQEFELHYERMVEELLASAEQQVNRARLLGSGVQLSIADVQGHK